MKKVIGAAIILCLCAAVLTGCGNDGSSNASSSNSSQTSSVQSSEAPAKATEAPTQKPTEEKNTQSKAQSSDAGEVSSENSGKMTKAKFDKIENGMSYEQVCEIVGSEGEVLSETGEKGSEYYTVMYQWDGSGGIGANANAMFHGGKMMTKAQFGLK